MAEWDHSSWVTETDLATRETELRAHIQEVSEQLSATTSAHGYSKDTATLEKYLEKLMEQLAALENRNSRRRAAAPCPVRRVPPEC